MNKWWGRCIGGFCYFLAFVPDFVLMMSLNLTDSLKVVFDDCVDVLVSCFVLGHWIVCCHQS